MHEDLMNGYCDYMEELGAINCTEVWVKDASNKHYGRTTTSETGDSHLIEIFGNDKEANTEILCHEIAHLILYKIGGSKYDSEAFKRMRIMATNFLKDYLRGLFHD